MSISLSVISFIIHLDKKMFCNIGSVANMGKTVFYSMIQCAARIHSSAALTVTISS